MSQEKVVETFDRWAEEGRDAELEREHGDVVRQVIEKLAIEPGEKILDLGCGNGWATRILAGTNAGVLAIGVDASPGLIARAEALHSLTIRARYEQGSFEELDFKDGTFERVFSMEALYYARDLERSIAEILRVLKPRGQAEILIDYYAESPASEPWGKVMGLALHRLGERDWQAAFERAGFRNVRTERVVDSRGPGSAQSFSCDECEPTWQSRVELRRAGTLWIHAEKA
jgi:ubiquinone/menaquinone biosynthesis C-methylase UbiE